ncbi:MAG: homoserine dehydrogenase [Flavobacteriales bacterium]
MSEPSLTLGAFGNGCVGQGFLELLNASRNTAGGGTAAYVKHVCVKERGRERAIGNATLTYEALDILCDDQVRAIVELTNDPVLALNVIRQALSTGRNAITASKRVVAENLAELIALQRTTGRSLLYEASCAGSIPVLRALETHFSGEEVLRIDGILNGTSNYILTRAQEEGLSLSEALYQAQQAGFAEADPRSDLNGADARYKLVILIAHAFGTIVRPSVILRQGIEELRCEDLAFGEANGWRLRSIASAYRCKTGLVAHVLPTFVANSDVFSLVRNEYNAVRIEGAHSGTHVLQGKGAGKLPTGLAVLSDVQQLIRGGGYGYAKVNAQAPELLSADHHIAVYARIPATHQELLARFNTLRPLDTTADFVQVTGTIALDELRTLIGEGRDGFQVIALPHLAADSGQQ